MMRARPFLVFDGIILLLLIAAIMLVILVITGHVRAEPLPQLKIGQCPSGYTESGGYCALMSDKVPCCDPEARAVPHRVGCSQALIA
jgi:hypothetical protein